MRGKQFIVPHETGEYPISLSMIHRHSWVTRSEMVTIMELDIGERYCLDVCPVCGRGDAEKVVIRVM